MSRQSILNCEELLYMVEKYNLYTKSSLEDIERLYYTCKHIHSVNLINLSEIAEDIIQHSEGNLDMFEIMSCILAECCTDIIEY